MQRHDRTTHYPGYPYPQHHQQQAPSHVQHPSTQSAAHGPVRSGTHPTSSAFSASANPNEDWTKISDLAERRRIQNRIAQRNYRKKLKKRLEDLERRAASSSASPEQKPQELDTPHASSQRSQQSSPQLSTATESTLGTPSSRLSSPQQYQGQYVAAPDEKGMFSHQYTRQLSTSPPPFSYATYPTTESVSYAHFTPYSSAPAPQSDMTLYPPYLPPIPSNYSNTTLPSIAQPVKHDYYPEEDMNPFSMSYASMAGIDIPVTNSYPHVIQPSASRHPYTHA